MEGFTCQHISGAKTDRFTMVKLGYISEVDYNDMASSNIIVHFPVTHTDIDASNHIFVHDIPSLKGKK